MRLPPTLASMGQTRNSQARVRDMSVCFFTVRCVWVRTSPYLTLEIARDEYHFLQRSESEKG